MNKEQKRCKTVTFDDCISAYITIHSDRFRFAFAIPKHVAALANRTVMMVVPQFFSLGWCDFVTFAQHLIILLGPDLGAGVWPMGLEFNVELLPL